jgi:hypothetical protein
LSQAEPSDRAVVGASARGRPRWPWIVLGLALAWSALVRVPLVLNAEAYPVLDSDLAVDGLTLIDAAHGHWRWHFPGTPAIGIGSLLACVPQAIVFGVNPATLVSGGAVLYGTLVVATFLLGWCVFGPRVAVWSLLPLTFTSVGPLWLSGRITGGHVLNAAWHAGALLWLYRCLAGCEGQAEAIPSRPTAPPPQPSPPKGEGWGGSTTAEKASTDGPSLRSRLGSALALGLWCGVGLYLDRMFLFTLIGLVPAALLALGEIGLSWRGAGLGLAAVTAGVVGYLPHEIGVRVDPYDAYHEQFDPILDRGALIGHARLLALECLPRLIAGYTLPGLTMEPGPAPTDLRGSFSHQRAAIDFLAVATTFLGLSLFGASLVALGWHSWASHPCSGAREDTGGPATSATHREAIARKAVCRGLLISSLAVVAGFILNKNIYNSDNYRYLVDLLVPWAIGFGRVLEGLARRGVAGAVVALAFALTWTALLTIEVGQWYDRFGWIDAHGRPVRQVVADPALAWLRDRPEIDAVLGSYWDVYRLAFLTGGRVRGVPLPPLPNRFPEWSKSLPGGQPRFLLVRKTIEGERWRRAAIRRGGRELVRSRDLALYSWP